MVELEAEDYSELFDWFTLCFGKGKKITVQAKRTFWKLNFLLPGRDHLHRSSFESAFHHRTMEL